MPLQLDRKAIVHVVDDDPSIREALQDLFLSIGLENADIPNRRGFPRHGSFGYSRLPRRRHPPA